MSNILIIAPHPDDEVLGCGGTIKKRSLAGKSVYLCVVTEAYTPEWSEEYITNKEKQIKMAQKVLGIKEIFFLKFPTVKLDTISQKKLNDELQKVIFVTKPEEVYIPHIGDINKDHRIVHESALVALRPKEGQIVKKIFAYETISETEWGTVNFWPNVYENIEETFVDKIKAMESYSSELKKFPHPRSLEVIEALAKKRGSEVGLSYAEAFMLIRKINQ